MINLYENVARMRKRHRGVLLDFDLSRVIFEAVIRCEIYWLKLILAKITIILAKCIAKFHKLCSLHYLFRPEHVHINIYLLCRIFLSNGFSQLSFSGFILEFFWLSFLHIIVEIDLRCICIYASGDT